MLEIKYSTEEAVQEVSKVYGRQLPDTVGKRAYTRRCPVRPALREHRTSGRCRGQELSRAETTKCKSSQFLLKSEGRLAEPLPWTSEG